MGKTGETICRMAVEQKLDEWDWQLVVDRAAFVRAVCEEVEALLSEPSEPNPKAIERAATLAAIRQYGPVLCDNCFQGEARGQDRAFREIGAYLYKLARFKTPNEKIAEDCTQQALLNIWQNREQARDKAAFLYWCKRILLNAIADSYRGGYGAQGERELDTGVDINEGAFEEGQGIDERMVEPESGRELETDPFEHTVQIQMREQLIAALRACLGNERQVHVIVRILLENKGHAEVAAELGITPLNVQVTKSRAMKTLKGCDAALGLYEQWFKL